MDLANPALSEAGESLTDMILWMCGPSPLGLRRKHNISVKQFFGNWEWGEVPMLCKVRDISSVLMHRTSLWRLLVPCC